MVKTVMLVWKKKASKITEFYTEKLAQSLSCTLTSLRCGTWRCVCVLCTGKYYADPEPSISYVWRWWDCLKTHRDTKSGSMTVMMLTDCWPVTGRRSVRPCDHSTGSSLCNMDTAWTDFCSNGVHGPAKEWISSNSRSDGVIMLPQGVE